MFEALANFYLGSDNQIKHSWEFAHQIEANSIEKIAETLRDSSNWTTRNTLNYRYLGFIRNLKSKVSITDAGELFLVSDWHDRQLILDEQISKMWLRNPTNPRKKIDIFPLPTLALICSQINSITLQEFYLVVTWINSDFEIEKCIELIKSLRSLSAGELRDVEERAIKYSGKKDLKGDSRRIFGMLQAHSAFKKLKSHDGEYRISLIGNQESAKEYFEHAITELRSNDLVKYESWLEEPIFLSLPTYLSESVVLEESHLASSLDASPISYPDLLLRPARALEKSKPKKKSIRQKIDFEARNQVSSNAGSKCEQIVLDREIKSLTAAGKADLAGTVRRVSLESESYGFDILSFDLDGNERHLEIKGVKQMSTENRIFMTTNEIETASMDVHYELIVVFNYDDPEPQIFNANQILDSVRGHNLRSISEDGNVTLKTQSLEILFAPFSSLT